jgi:hypothetical protein
MGFGAKVYTLTKADIDAVLGYDVSAHEDRHAEAGADEIDAGDLVEGADPQSATALAAALAHASRHASGQPDVVTPAAIAAVAKTGDEEIAGVKSFTSIPVGPAADPTADNEFTRKAYVDPLGVSMWGKDWGIETISADPLAGYTFYPDAVRFETRDAPDEWRLYTGTGLDVYGWRTEIRLVGRFHRGVDATYTPEIWMVIGRTTDPKHNTTIAMFGFRHYNNSIYAYCASGTAATSVNLNVIAGDPTWVEARWVNGSRIEYYVDGVLKTVITTNVPSAGASITPRLVIQVTGASGQLNDVRYAYILKPRVFIPKRKFALTDINASGEWSGLYRWGTAGEALSKYDICYRDVTSGNLKKAQANAAGTMPGLFMALEDIANGAEGKFLCTGFITNSGWAWTIGDELLVSDTVAGGITQTLPADPGDQVQRVGMAESATVIYFKPDVTVVEIA